jgi:ribosomal protein S15
VPTALPIVQKAHLSRDEKKIIQRRQPYKWAQMQARREVLLKRQNEVKAQHEAKWGSPIHGITTPFVESFDSAGHEAFSRPPTDEDGNPLEEPHELPTSPHILNHFTTKSELEEAIRLSHQLAEPIEDANRMTSDPVEEERERKQFENNHKTAVEVLHRITDMSNASSKHRLHANIRRCIETFGRHNTDHQFRPKPLSINQTPREVVPRAGADTGSSEVQIAILTARIRKLAQMFEGHKGKKDKANRRNLRALVHRRQRLLAYMERKERGSERWHFMLKTLGLSPATWKGCIQV